MTIQPRDIDTVYEELRDKLTGKTEKLTNFAETGFNYVWTRAFSRDIQEQEEKIVASMLAGWPDYAGKE
jgi:FAD synthase